MWYSAVLQAERIFIGQQVSAVAGSSGYLSLQVAGLVVSGPSDGALSCGKTHMWQFEILLATEGMGKEGQKGCTSHTGIMFML